MPQAAAKTDPVTEAQGEVTHWRQRLGQLQRDYNAVQEDRERLRVERGRLIAEGGRASQAHLDRLQREGEQADRRLRELEAGIQHAEERLKATQAAEAEAGRLARNDRVRELAKKREALAQQVDRRLRACLADLEQMEALRKELRRTSQVKDETWFAYFPNRAELRFSEHILRLFGDYLPSSARLPWSERWSPDRFVNAEADGWRAYLEEEK